MAYAGVLTVSNRHPPPTHTQAHVVSITKKFCFYPPPDGEEGSLGRRFLAGQVGSNSISYQRYGISITPLFTHL